MIIVLTSRKGVVKEIISTDNYSKLLDKLNWLIEDLESRGYFLVKEKPNIYEFASKKNGWEYGIMVADGWTKKISSQKLNKE